MVLDCYRFVSWNLEVNNCFEWLHFNFQTSSAYCEFLLSANSGASFHIQPCEVLYYPHSTALFTYLAFFINFFLASFKSRGRENPKKTRARIVSGIYSARIEKIQVRSRSGQLCVTSGSVPGSPKPRSDPNFCHPHNSK